MISSTMPSAKYSCSGSPLILAKGSTAIDGLSGSGSAGADADGPWQRTASPNPVDPHRPGDVLDLLLAQIFEDKGQPVAHVVMDRVGDANPAGLGQRFEPRRDVDAVADRCRRPRRSCRRD